jgi:hypothetical protein
MSVRSFSTGRLVVAGVVIVGMSFVGAGTSSAAGGPVGLGNATSFAVLAGSTVTNTGPTVIAGDVGLSPGTAIVSGGMVVDGTSHAADTEADDAKADLVIAYDDAAGRLPATPVPVELGGTTLVGGVYSSDTLGLTGTLTLDAQGDTDAVFVFQAASTLITASNSVVAFVNGASPCNVFWQVGSSATIGTSSAFVGTVMALESITVNTNATIQGRLLARNAAVTLDSNVIDSRNCAEPLPPPTTTTTTAPASSVPGDVTTTPGGSQPGDTTTPGGSQPGDVTTTPLDETSSVVPSSPPVITLPVTGSQTVSTATAGAVALVAGVLMLLALPRIPRRRRR